MNTLKKYTTALFLLAALVAWDIQANQATTFFQDAQPDDLPLQVEGAPILRPGTLTLGEGRPTVAVAASTDETPSAPLDANLSYEQVDAIVRRALDLDQSGSSIRDVIDPDDWVLLKVNIVTNRGNRSSAYYTDGIEHPGQITDLRVVKSVINYLIEHVGPRRITIAEGGAESPRKGAPGFPTNGTDDGWSITYEEFDNLSYMKILDEFAVLDIATRVDSTDLNYAPYRREPVPGGPIQRLGVERLTYAGAQFGYHREGTGTFPDEGFFMPEPILDADKVISIAAMKTTIYGTTLGIKNYVGTLASGAYGDGTSKRQHYRNNPEHGYVDLFSYNPAAYTIIEGFWGTEGDGPQSGQNVQHNVVVAGSDPVATESIANVAMGFNPLDLEALYLAAAKGFGTLDREKITVVGNAPESVQYHFAKSRGGSRQGFFYGRGIRRWLVNGPFEGADLDAPYLQDEAQLNPQEEEVTGWQKVEHLGYSAEVLDLGAVNGTASNASNYAFTLVHSAETQPGFLWIGYDERLRVWLNGEIVYENPARRSFALADQKIPVQLQRGENRLLFKLGNVSGPSWLAAHLVDEDGDRLPDIRFALPGERATAVAEQTGAQPESFALLGNYPNPFNPATTVYFSLPQEQHLDLAIYNAAGQRIRTLSRDTWDAGYHQIAWDGRDDAGFNSASGIYIARLQSEKLRQSHSMLLLR